MNRRAHLLSILPLFLLPVIGLTACETHGVASVEPSPRGEELYDKIDFAKGLDRNLAIELVRTDEKEHFLRVQVDLRNKSTLKQVIRYKYEWFNENGLMVAETDSTWVEAALFPGETSSFLGTAGSKNATDFRFKVTKK
jgi:uncharacterized protein YcfL